MHVTLMARHRGDCRVSRLILQSSDSRTARARSAVRALWVEAKIAGGGVHVKWVGDASVPVQAGKFAPFRHAHEALAVPLVLAVVDNGFGPSAKVRLLFARCDAVEGRAGGLLAQRCTVIVVI